ncbi:MAG: NADP-specific glutamate dehydrogenase [Bdellovibrionota bacterium]|nr:NADP-specific glutamate dehydrogenase [Bdellovibrionota bacterium]
MNTITLDQTLERFHKDQVDFKSAVHEIYDDIVESGMLSHKDIDRYFMRLIEPNRSLRFKVEWYDDNNKLHVNRGYRIQFNNALGPYKGGLRFHKDVSEDTFKFLGFEQIFKNALTGLPMGGAKGGADFDPKGKSDFEIMRFCQAFMSELYKHIGPNIDIPAGDIGVGTREIGYLYGHYLKLTDQYTGVLTGKGYNFGGSCVREEATGYGATYLLDEALKEHQRKIDELNVLVSGAGNVALHAAEKLIDLSARVLTLSDSGGTLHFPKGLTAVQLQKIKKHKLVEHKRLKDIKDLDSEFYEGKKPWGIKADCAFPCATQNEINNEEIKELIKNGVWCFVEGANMPLSSKALESLDGGQLYLPGKAANAGGVAVSGFERTQNSIHHRFSAGEINERLKEVMKEIHHNCKDNTKVEGDFLNYKKGANLYSFKKIYNTTLSLGI